MAPATCRSTRTTCEVLLRLHTDQPVGTLYIGVTSNLLARLYQHRSGETLGFVSTYKLDRLIYYEEYSEVDDALAREKQLKRWRRDKKLKLIATMNADWRDLSQAMLWG